VNGQAADTREVRQSQQIENGASVELGLRRKGAEVQVSFASGEAIVADPEARAAARSPSETGKKAGKVLAKGRLLASSIQALPAMVFTNAGEPARSTGELVSVPVRNASLRGRLRSGTWPVVLGSQVAHAD
jgi:hypothetical protein